MLSIHDLLFVDLLGTCEITQIQFTLHYETFGVWSVCLNQKLEDGVGTRRVDIGSCLSRDSILLSSLE